MVKIFALPANEGDFIWVAYGENEVYSHILIEDRKSTRLNSSHSSRSRMPSSA